MVVETVTETVEVEVVPADLAEQRSEWAEKSDVAFETQSCGEWNRV